MKLGGRKEVVRGEMGRVVVVGVGRKDGGDELGEVSRRRKIPGFLILDTEDGGAIY